MNSISIIPQILARLILTMFLLLACEKQAEKSVPSGYPLDTAKLISSVSSGLLSSEDIIKVKFVNKMVDNDQVDVAIKKTVFEFEPSVDGVAQWIDEQTLVFKPNVNWTIRQKYIGTLELNDLLPETDKTLDPLSFNFLVAGRELRTLDTDFKLVEANDPENVYLEGKTTFSENTNSESISNASAIKIQGRDLTLQWTEVDPKTFKFKSDIFKRTNRDQKVEIQINKNELELSTDFNRKLILPAIKSFKVVDIFVDSESRQPQIKIEFSDQISSTQNIEGFISVKPTMDIKLQPSGNQIYVRGNFEHGQKYVLNVQPGIRSRWATKTEKVFSEEIQFEDVLPEIRFSSDGVFLPSANQKKILFQTVNVRKVDLEIIKVFENNLGQFLQLEALNGTRDRRDYYDYSISRVGLEVVEKDLEIGSTQNRWLQHELDLSTLIDPKEKGLFLIKLSFKKEDMIYETSETDLEYRRRRSDWYYNDPSSYGYIYAHGQVFKPIILSDIGVIVKKGNKNHHVFTTNLLDATSMTGVKIRLMTFQHQKIAEGFTDGRGIIEFKDIEQEIFYVEAEKSGQRSVIKVNEMDWNVSTFDTEGVESGSDGLRAFIYSERGVYRPGDPINISAIFRNEDDTFPENHPVHLKITNPRNQLVHETTVREATDGFYHFPFSTRSEDLTGAYRCEFKAGSQTFYHVLKIETVVAERLKVELKAAKKIYSYNDKHLDLTLSAKYLFGNPAARLQSQVSLNMQSIQRPFNKYNNYIFNNEASVYYPSQHSLFYGELDSKGEAKIHWKLPGLENVPGPLSGTLNARVTDKGGRASKGYQRIIINPYPYYVGLEKPELKYWYARTGQELDFQVVLVDPNGEAVTGRTLNYRVYRNERHWWWEYDSRDQYRLRYKKDTSTELVKQGTLVSGQTPVGLVFTPENRGEYLIEIQDTDSKGHISATFISAYPWGQAPAAGKNAGILALSTDKEKYQPGETAILTFPVPDESSVLFTLEKGHKVIESKWFSPDSDTNEMRLEVPVTADMLPTTYASVSVIQPHSQTANDRPIRLYGIVPLNVEQSSTRQRLIIESDDILRPEQKFSVTVKTVDRSASQITIAVVDEGLLSLTRFETPDPWLGFYRKQRLGVLTSDLFGHVIGANKGDIFRTFSIGGGMMELAFRKDQLDEQKAKRFQPVCLFQGPFPTNENGEVSAEFELPNYIGSVRIMAVSAKGKRYGNAEKNVPVKTDLMVMPTLPRVIGPEDKFVLPVTVFAMKDNIGTVEIDLQVEGPLTIEGPEELKLNFEKISERDIRFRLGAKSEVGLGKIKITASSDDHEAKYETELSVRASSPQISEVQTEEVQPGGQISFQIPDKGILGTNRASISIQRRPNFNFSRRILWLIRYPYGCIEQTVSSVFPQLYLKEFIPKSRAADRDIDKNINIAIQRLQKFKLPNGGFTYWPGNREVSEWGTLYAGHFLVEAKKLGYHISNSLLESWINFQKAKAREQHKNKFIQSYRLYVLALSGEAQIGPMNLLKENHFDKLNNTGRWLLAAAYQIAGVDQVAGRILTQSGLSLEEYEEFAGTYGSALRDKAMILEQMVLFERWSEANQLAGELAVALAGQRWYSTQTTGYCLLALGKYLSAIEGQEENPLLIGSIRLPDGSEHEFDTRDIGFNLNISSGFGENVDIELDGKSSVKRAFVSMNWSGKPARHFGENESNNVKLVVSWLDEDGMPIQINKLKQGTVFWGHFKVTKPKTYRNKIEELALVQLLPTGWEIENIRINNASMPRWMRSWKLNREEFLDIRDDRVMWFFDMNAYEKQVDFVVKLTAVTTGDFLLPPTLLEAMYNNSYKATVKGQSVSVSMK